MKDIQQVNGWPILQNCCLHSQFYKIMKAMKKCTLWDLFQFSFHSQKHMNFAFCNCIVLTLNRTTTLSFLIHAIKLNGTHQTKRFK